MGKEDSVVAYVMVLSVLGVIEGVIGFMHGNVHVIRDFLTSLLMIGSLILSYNSAKMARKKRTEEQTFGNRRLNIIAAFVNTVFI